METLLVTASPNSSSQIFAPKLEDLIQGAIERLSSQGQSISSTQQPLPNDKWLLSSAVQKLIRRGKVAQAVKAALALHTVDPDYLPRRLPIIAFEDVGVGDLIVCFDVLHTFRRQKFPANISSSEQRGLLVNLVGRLARSTKSRTGCDIFCLANVDQHIARQAAIFAKSSEQCLVAMASDRGAEMASRALALHMLSGMSLQEGRWQRAVTRFNGRGLLTVADKLGVPEAIAWMMAEGRHTAGLAAMLPLGWEMASGAIANVEKSKFVAQKRIFGLPAYSADMYTRIGKSAIAEFTKALWQMHPKCFESVPSARTCPKIVGMALFHIEGSKLDRWLENTATFDLRQKVESVELEALGLYGLDSRQELYALLQAECSLLWEIRRSHLRAAYTDGARQ